MAKVLPGSPQPPRCRVTARAGYTPSREGVVVALDPAAGEFRGEDGFGEDDWDSWVRLTERLGTRIQLVGDDLFVTNPAIIAEAIEKKVANASLIKVNQIGTVAETLQAIRVSREAGYAPMVSHRSGETEDAFIADLVIGAGCGQNKSWPARGERVAKYNRLIEIAAADQSSSHGLHR